MPRQSFVAAAVIGAAVLTTTGITYASSESDGASQAAPPAHPVARPVHQAAPLVKPAAPPALPAAPPAVQAAPPAANHPGGVGASEKRDEGREHSGHGGEGGREGSGRGGRGGEGGGREGRGGEDHGGREGRDHKGGDREGRGHEHKRERIFFNERSYSAFEDGCITAVSGLGSTSFSVFNDSKKTVEVYRGFTCDNGGPVATVGPHGETFGVATRTAHGGMFGFDNGVVGSFRVVGYHHGDDYDYDYGDW
ncbi:hypothetical protein [Streptomyces sp. NPDC001020]